MARLTSKQKQWIVIQLAQFYTPSEVADLFKEEFETSISRQQAALYNPETATGEELSDELRALFEQHRKSFLNDRSRIAIAHQNYRLRELDSLFRANRKRSPLIAMKLLEQAAKEEGGGYIRKTDEKGEDALESLPAELEAAIVKVYGEDTAGGDISGHDPAAESGQ